MAKSPFFVRIKGDVLKIVSAIPEGKCCTYASIGEHLDVVPRHVAYILSSLSDNEKANYPWYRVVGQDGALGQLKVSHWGAPQGELLRNEGLLIANNRLDLAFQRWFISASALESGVAQHTRPTDAPSGSSKSTRSKKKD
jgi:methylated-DNA-protein-cysteine methyltransferase related protein